MKTTIIVLLAIISSSLSAIAQETATVFIARKKIYTGTAGPLKVFMDGELICRINNNAYSTHSIKPGKHKFSVQYYSKESKGDDKNEDQSVMVDIQPGKDYYIKASKENKGLITIIMLEEVTANSWPKLKDGLDQDDCL